MLLHVMTEDITAKRVAVLGVMLDRLNIFVPSFFCHCASVVIHIFFISVVWIVTRVAYELLG